MASSRSIGRSVQARPATCYRARLRLVTPDQPAPSARRRGTPRPSWRTANAKRRQDQRERVKGAPCRHTLLAMAECPICGGHNSEEAHFWSDLRVYCRGGRIRTDVLLLPKQAR
jgi:hypothetical protein